MNDQHHTFLKSLALTRDASISGAARSCIEDSMAAGADAPEGVTPDAWVELVDQAAAEGVDLRAERVAGNLTVRLEELRS
jgi:hypothetical protein